MIKLARPTNASARPMAPKTQPPPLPPSPSARKQITGHPSRPAAQPPAQPPAYASAKPPVPLHGNPPPVDQMQVAAIAMLKLQAEVMEARTRAELAYLVANEPRQIMRAQQIVVLARGQNGDLRTRAVSSITQVDRSSPAILWFESMVQAVEREHGLGTDCGFKATAFGGGYQSFGESYPLGHLMWVPWLDRNGKVFGGMLLARSMPFTSAEAAIGRHLAGTFSQAWRALGEPGWRSSRLLKVSRWTLVGTAVATLLALVFPVPMTALAPVETAPRGPSIITAGVEGVVGSVLVEPNQPVTKGQMLVRMVDTTHRNRFEIAEREVGVAAMRYKKSAQLAFTDVRGRHDLAIAQAELELKTSERNYAAELLERTEIKAERDGVAFFADKKDLVGKPIAVGEKLMEIASPSEIEFRIDLGVADAIVLRDEARVKIFLDSDPLHSIEAKLVRAAYRARVRDNQQLAFRLVAEAEPDAVAALRLGARGTAQIYSDSVPLGFYLMRRPIAAARQWFGL